MKKILLLILFSTIVSAQKYKIDGFGKTGYKFFDRNPIVEANQMTYFYGKLQAEFEVSKKLEAQIDLRGYSEDENVEFKEFSLKYKASKYLRFKIGNIKKPFGYLQLESRDDLPYAERGYIHEKLRSIGYGGRVVSLMAYYKYNEKRPEFPYSYWVSIYKDNGYNSGLFARWMFHSIVNFALSFNYNNRGGEEGISTIGFESDLSYVHNNGKIVLETFYLRDPEASVIFRQQNKDENIYPYGFKFLTAYKFEQNFEHLKFIEPFVLLGYYNSDSFNEDKFYQLLVGTNFYVTKKFRVGVNADLRLIDNKFIDDMESDDSRGVIEFQVKF